MATVQFNEIGFGSRQQSWVTEMRKLTNKAILEQIHQHGASLDSGRLPVMIEWAANGRDAEIKRGDMTIGKIHVLRLSL